MVESDEQKEFEAQVRLVARQLWAGLPGQGPVTVDGKERDGVYETEETFNLVECTVSRSKDKAVRDSEKLNQLYDRIAKEYPRKSVKAWFVTREEPTADQRTEVLRYKPKIVPIGYAEFKAKLINFLPYLSAREMYPFGSAREPDQKVQKSDADYVHPTLVIGGSSAQAESLETSISELAAKLVDGAQIALLGDYGAGKSMALREIWRKLAHQARNGKTYKFPLLLNLRDHHGQASPVEAIMRHCHNVGFPHYDHLVRAWRAGGVVVMLDGFDEITGQAWNRDVRRLRDSRYRAMALVREFIGQTPSGSGLVVAGRDHYFDNPAEFERALALGSDVLLVQLQEFTDEQIRSYLGRRGLDLARFPAWLPTRPLLLSYLANRSLLSDALAIGESRGAAESWDELLDRICRREAEIEPNLAGDDVRGILERVASLARRTPEGLGPVTYEEINSSFVAQCGYAPDERAATLLQRLPGLGVYRLEESSRAFVDADLASCARAGELVRFVDDAYNVEPTAVLQWECELGEIGAEVVAWRVRRNQVPIGRLGNAVGVASSRGYPALAADLVGAHLAGGIAYEGASTIVEGALIRQMDLGDLAGSFSELTFRNCVFRELVIPTDLREDFLPKFERCLVSRVSGRVGATDLPSGIASNCEVDQFEGATETNSQIMDLPLSRGRKVALTVLRKLYLQAGKGRKENALVRGMAQTDRELVPAVMEVLQRASLASRSRSGDLVLWMPNRVSGERARRLLASPSVGDAVLLDCDRIG